MSKHPLQFLEVPRRNPQKQAVEVRLKNFGEIYGSYDGAHAASQAEHCISCGNPYCEWKCPVYKYIPDWLRLVEEGKLFQAAELSHQTNSLPEICGRICPQDKLCEGACTLNDGIGAIERYISDEAFKRGWRPDTSDVVDTGKCVGIVGAGPGTEHVIPADAVIIAFGFRPSPPAWLDNAGIGTLPNGRVRVDSRGDYPYQTANPKVFAGGDMLRGSDLVVTAVFEGREAARGICRYLGI